MTRRFAPVRVTIAGRPLSSKQARPWLVALIVLCCAAGVAEGLGATAVAVVCLLALYILCQVAVVVGYVARARRERRH